MLGLSTASLAQENFHDGPAFDQFSLTLDSGSRTEASGPFYYDQQKDTETTRAIPPFFSSDGDPRLNQKNLIFFTRC